MKTDLKDDQCDKCGSTQTEFFTHSVNDDYGYLCDKCEKKYRECSEQKYILIQDDDSHWYVIPADKEQEWHEWCDIDPDDERSWTPPDFAESVGGSTSLVKFTGYEIK